MIVQSEFHDRLELSTRTPKDKRNLWEKVLDLQRAYDPMLERIKFLAGKGLTLMMVLFDFLSQCIAPGRMTPRSWSAAMGQAWTGRCWMQCSQS
jgi:hypothetical protein